MQIDAIRQQHQAERHQVAQRMEELRSDMARKEQELETLRERFVELGGVLAALDYVENTQSRGDPSAPPAD